MNISPISFANYSKPLGFKGKSKGATPPEGDKDKSVSKQNNAPELTVDPSVYAAVKGRQLVDSMINAGMIEVADDDDPNAIHSFKELQEKLAEKDGEDEGFDVESEMELPEDFGEKFQGTFLDVANNFDEIFNEELPDDFMDEAVDMQAQTLIHSLKFATESLDRVPNDKKAKIPTIIKFTSDDFIKSMELQAQLMSHSNLNEVFAMTDFSSTPEYDKLTDEQKQQTDMILGMTMSLSQSSFFDQIAAIQVKMIDSLKTKYKPEFDSAVKGFSSATNYMLYNAMEAGFNRDPRTLINSLTDNIQVYCPPEIKDNEDGTSTYTYKRFTTKVDVVRNNSNGDYVSAECMHDGMKQFDVKFREDGSVEDFNYNNRLAKSEINIKTNSENDKMTVLQKMSDIGGCRRVFKKTEDGNLKLIGFNFYTDGK